MTHPPSSHFIREAPRCLGCQTSRHGHTHPSPYPEPRGGLHPQGAPRVEAILLRGWCLGWAQEAELSGALGHSTKLPVRQQPHHPEVVTQCPWLDKGLHTPATSGVGQSLNDSLTRVVHFARVCSQLGILGVMSLPSEDASKAHPSPRPRLPHFHCEGLRRLLPTWCTVPQPER